MHKLTKTFYGMVQEIILAWIANDYGLVQQEMQEIGVPTALKIPRGLDTLLQ